MTVRPLMHIQRYAPPPRIRIDYPTGIFCKYCGEELEEGEQYITNENGETVHYYCLNDIEDLIDFMDIEIETAVLYYGEENHDV